jgi:hypothetical protein
MFEERKINFFFDRSHYAHTTQQAVIIYYLSKFAAFDVTIHTVVRTVRTGIRKTIFLFVVKVK